MAGLRRIDALYCDRATADAKIQEVCAQVLARAEGARQEVVTAVAERVEALQRRQMELIAQIDKIASAKSRVLGEQLEAIRGGACPPAPPEDPDDQVDPDRFLLRTDAVTTFGLGGDDFLEKIPAFGKIGESSTYASQSYAQGPGLAVQKTGNPSYVWVFSCDRDGGRRKDGGDRVAAVFSSPEDFRDVEVKDLEDGRYKVTFVPAREGSFTLRLLIGPEGDAEDVRGGPFPVLVRGPSDYGALGEDPEGKAKIAEVGQPHIPDKLGAVHHPCGVEFDRTGKFVFVCDQSNHRIQIFSSDDHGPLHTFGRGGFGVQDLNTPSDVVVDRSDRVVVSDLLNHRIQIFQFARRSLELRHMGSVGAMGTGPGEFQFPKGLGLTEHGQVLVCDSGNHRVQVFDMNDNYAFVREFGQHGTGDGQFVSPLDITVNVNDEILVSDSSNRIQLFDLQGVFLRSFGASKGRRAPKRGLNAEEGTFNHPASMAVNDENALFVCDQGNYRIQVLSATDGTFLHKWGGSRKKKADGEEEEPPPEDDEERPPEWQGIRRPAGIAVNSEGKVVVCDFDANTLFTF